MMKMKLVLFHVLTMLIVVVTTADAAQEAAVKLRYRFVPGQKLAVTLREASNDVEEKPGDGTRAESGTSVEITQEWTVGKVTPEGEASVEMRYKRLTFVKSVGPGVEVTIDTRRGIRETNPILVEAGPMGEPAIAKLEAIRTVFAQVFLDEPFRFVVSGTGRVRDVTGYDAAWEKYRLNVESLLPNLESRGELDAAIEGFFGEDAVHKLFSYTLFAGLPAGPSKVGDEWSDATDFTFQAIQLHITRNYRLAEADGKGRFAIDGRIVFDPPTSTEEVSFTLPGNTLTASITADPANGLLLKQEYSGKLEFEAFEKTTGNNDIILRFSSDITGSVTISNKAGEAGEAEAIFNEGVAHFKAERYGDAINSFNRAKELKPDWSLPYERIGLCYYFLGRYDEAIDAFKQAMRLEPDRAAPYAMLGSVYNELHREEEAVVPLKTAVSLDPDNLDAYMELGHACRELGRYDEAVEAYKQVLRSEEKKMSGTWFLGVTYRLMGDYAGAVEAFKETLKMNPDDAATFYFLGGTYAAMGDSGEAVKCYEKTIALDAGHVGARVDLGHLYFDTGNYAKAADVLEEVLRIDAGNVEVRAGLGFTYLRQGNREAAMEQYTILKDLDPRLAEILLGEINK